MLAIIILPNAASLAGKLLRNRMVLPLQRGAKAGMSKVPMDLAPPKRAELCEARPAKRQRGSTGRKARHAFSNQLRHQRFHHALGIGANGQ